MPLKTSILSSNRAGTALQIAAGARATIWAAGAVTHRHRRRPWFCMNQRASGLEPDSGHWGGEAVYWRQLRTRTVIATHDHPAEGPTQPAEAAPEVFSDSCAQPRIDASRPG